MAAESIQCSVITPEAQVFDAAASSVVFAAHDGLVGVLKDRAPLVCELGIGVLRVDTVDSGPHEFFIDGGFAQVLENRVDVLTERAIAAEDLLRADAEKEREAASRMPIKDDASFQARQDAIARASVKLRLARQ
ncbi:MAG: ATP synthase F1 subunit epsilon [Phycisphaerae bacterium]|nr:ATP synthase F1 subunit epsilon [Phycisphaerae bacterium]